MKNKHIFKLLDKIKKGKILLTDDVILQSSVNIFTLINLRSKQIQTN